ncbi:hypothetical protein ABW21_db0209860 [Orbilia brochopaga]|nr:hypothetical protein ABW21_db0209860 [Drechslerella brochopaga]
MNEVSKNAESGFWVEPGIFVTALHFAEWAGMLPTADEISKFINDPHTKITISGADINERGSRDDEDSVPIFLENYILRSDIALWLPVSPSIAPTNCLRLDLLLEAHEVGTVASELIGARVFAVGYNGPPDRELWDWIRRYQLRVSETANPRLIREPEMSSWLHPYRKTLTHGSIAEIDLDRGEVKIDASMYKGFSGAFVGVQNPRDPGQPVLIAIVYGGDRDGLYNKANLFPSGFKEQIRILGSNVQERQQAREYKMQRAVMA